MIPFGIIWFVFVIFWEVNALSGGAPLFFAFWGIPFILLGLYITVGRFIHIAWLRKRTAYVITNKKIIRKRGKRVDMLGGTNMPQVHITTHADGSGTIRFGSNYTFYRNSFDTGRQVSTFALENVPDVTRVHQIISTMDR